MTRIRSKLRGDGPALADAFGDLDQAISLFERRLDVKLLVVGFCLLHVWTPLSKRIIAFGPISVQQKNVTGGDSVGLGDHQQPFL